MSPLMPLRPTTVRFAEDGMRFVQQAAEEVGSTVSQFVREAALIRAAWVMHEKDLAADPNGTAMSRFAEEVRRLAREND